MSIRRWMGVVGGGVCLLLVGCASRGGGSSVTGGELLFRDAVETARAAAEGGRYEAAVWGYAEARRVAIRAGNLGEATRSALRAGQWAIAAGRGEEAERWLRLAEQEGRLMGVWDVAARALLLRGWFALERGETAAAREACEGVLALWKRTTDRDLERDVRLFRAELALREGGYEEARRELEAISRRAKPVAGSPAAAMAEQILGGILEGEGRKGEAAERYEGAAFLWERVGRPDRAARAWKRASELWKEEREAERGVVALIRAALQSEAIGERASAIRMVREAAEWAAATGMGGWAEWAMGLEGLWQKVRTP